MTLASMLWLRIFAQAGMALAFSALTVVLAWLSLRRYVGHRRLLASGCVFSVLNSMRSLTLMVGLYQGSPASEFSVWTQVFTAIFGIAFASLVMVSMGDLLNTLTGTEAHEMVRQDRNKDELQAQQLLQFMAAENRRKSIEMLSDSAAREAQLSE